MQNYPKVIFRLSDVPLLESPSGDTRNSVMITNETCGSRQYMAGLFFIQPGARGHSGSHKGQEELYYIIAGQGQVVVDEIAYDIGPGDVVFIPDGAKHHLVSSGAESLSLFWVMPQQEGSPARTRQALKAWRLVDPASSWSDRIP